MRNTLNQVIKQDEILMANHWWKETQKTFLAFKKDFDSSQISYHSVKSLLALTFFEIGI